MEYSISILQDTDFTVILILTAGKYCTSMLMKMSHLVHGSLVSKLSILMTAVCAVGLLQVWNLKICN